MAGVEKSQICNGFILIFFFFFRKNRKRTKGRITNTRLSDLFVNLY